MLYVAISVGNGTWAEVSAPITSLFSQISMIWLLLHIEFMIKMYHSKNYWIWLKNKKVMAKFVPVGNGTARDIEKYTQFSNCLILLNFREKIFFLSLVCCQICWVYLEVTMIHISYLEFFLGQVLAKTVASVTGRR